MPTAEFFTRFGLFVCKNLLEQELCARCCNEMNAGAQAQATIVGHDATKLVDKTIRKVKWVHVPAATVSLVKSRLLALMPTLERHFNVALTGCQPLQFLTYREGDFYRPHNDGENGADAPTLMRERKVSVVIFLNSQSQQPADDTYCGGSLTFYGLIDDPRWQTYGFPLNSEPGLLIAFRSETMHQVLPVTYGKRYSIASWLF